jgi:hypothetical protein
VTGYLQRIVANATNPSGAVHPVLRPIYSNAMTDDTGDRSEFMADAAASRVSDAVPPSGPLKRSESDGPPRVATSRGAPPIEAPTIHKPAPPAVDRTTPPPQPAADVAPPPMHGGEAAARMHGAAEPPAAASFERSFAPLVPASGQSESAPRHARDDPAHWSRFVATHRERTAIMDAARHRADEPDNIEIHIGRIEVTAVQPAPVRPTPTRPPRHAPSLEDYLKRRNGRAS